MNKLRLPALGAALARARPSRRLGAALGLCCVLGVAAGLAAAPRGDASARAAADMVLPQEDAAAAALKDLAPSLTGVWVTLGLFVLLGGGLVLLLRGGRRFAAANGVLHVVDTLPLGGRRMIHLIRCDGRKYLIGNSERGIHYLASLPQDAAEREVDDLAADERSEPSFPSFLDGGRRR